MPTKRLVEVEIMRKKPLLGLIVVHQPKVGDLIKCR